MTPTLHMDSQQMLPDDAEMERLAAYLLRELPVAELEKFEQDLRDDEAFFDRVAPFIKVWYSRAPGYTMAQTRERARARALAIKSAEPRQAVVETPVTPISSAKSRRRLRDFNSHMIFAVGSSILAAGLFFAIARRAHVATQPTVETVATLPKPEPRDTGALRKPPATAPKRTPSVTPKLAPKAVEVVELPDAVPAINDSAVDVGGLPSVSKDHFRIDRPAGAIPTARVIAVGRFKGDTTTESTNPFHPIVAAAKALGDKVGSAINRVIHPRQRKPDPVQPKVPQLSPFRR